MRAVCCRDYGPPECLEWVEVPEPQPGPGQVLVEVQAAGVGYVDGLLIQGRYQVKPPLPYYPGSEFAGRVLAVGDDVGTTAVGERVFGTAGSGAFGERVVVSARACRKLPEHLDIATAAGLYINYATALYGLRDLGHLQPDETVVVLGAGGGVGSAAVAMAKAMGARVIAGASSAAKLDAARAAGADLGVDYSQPDWRAALRDVLAGTPLDLVYDPVGGELSEPAFRSLSPGGRLLVVGFASGSIASLPLNLPLLKRSAVVGVDWGGASRADPAINDELLGTVCQWIETRRLVPAPVCQRPFAELVPALQDQLAGRIVGKLVLTR